MTSLSNATTDDSKSKNEYLGAEFFSRIAGELLQLPDAIKTTRIATKIVNGFKRDAVSTRAREEIGTLVAKCLHLGCSELIFQRITHDQENSNGAFFNDFNELPENIFVQLALSLIHI